MTDGRVGALVGGEKHRLEGRTAGWMDGDEQLLETRMKCQTQSPEGSNVTSCVSCFTPEQAHREPSSVKPDLQGLLISTVKTFHHGQLDLMALNTGLEEMFIIDTPSWYEATPALGWEIRAGSRKAVGGLQGGGGICWALENE